MAKVRDVAAYILSRKGPMTAMKLQKLVYYCQAWHLVWDEERLFNSRIEAWANGPVCRELYCMHPGRFELQPGSLGGNESQLSKSQQETIDAVLKAYGNKTAQWLVDLTHMERPWQEARGDLPPNAKCENEITLAAMHEYYSGLDAQNSTL